MTKCKYCGATTPGAVSKCPHCGRNQPLLTSRIIPPIFIGAVIMLILAAISSTHTPSPPSQRTTSVNYPQVDPREEVKKNPTKYIKIVKQSWRKGGFGSVAIHNLTIRNESNYDIKDISIKFSYLSDSGTLLDYNVQTIYQIIKAKKTRTFYDVNAGLVHSQATRGGVDQILSFEFVSHS